MAVNIPDFKSDTSTQSNLVEFPKGRGLTSDKPNYKFTNNSETTNLNIFDILTTESVSRNKIISKKSIDFSYKETHNNEKKNNIISNNSYGDGNMDKILEKYIDKMDRDQSDLKNDIRATEDRIARNIELSETRNSEKLNNIEDMIKDHFNKIDEKYNKIDERYSKLEDKIDNNNKFIISISVTTIIGIAAMVVAIILALK